MAEIRNLNAKQYFTLLGAIFLSTNLLIFLNVPFLRQILVFLCYTIIPGLLILHILKLNKIEFLNKFVLSIGLSIAFLMLTGSFLNWLLPAAGYVEPISVMPLTVLYSVIIAALCIMAYLREQHHRPITNSTVNIKKFLSPFLLLLLVLLIFVLGALMVAYWQNNTLLMIALPAVTIILILSTLNRLIPGKLFPLLIGVISLAMMYQLTLMSPLLSGSDIYLEYYFQNQVLKASRWVPSIQHNYNSVLSTNMVLPIYSLLTNIESTWLFKVIYPFFYSLAIVGMFEVFRNQFGRRISLLACFLLISLIPSTYIFSLARQQLAEFFLVLVLIVMLDTKLTGWRKSLLAIIFFTSIVVSHYTVSIIFLGFILLSFLQLSLIKSRVVANRLARLWPKMAYQSGADAENHLFLHGVTFPTLCVIIWMAWCIYISSGSMIISLRNLGQTVIRNLVKDFLSPEGLNPLTVTALGLDFWEVQGWGKIYRVVQYAIQGFTVIGVAVAYLRPQRLKLNLEFLVLANSALLLLLLSIVVPHFATALNIARIYHLAMIFLSPFCILGGAVFWGWLSRVCISRIGVFKEARFRLGEKRLEPSTYITGHTQQLIFITSVLIMYFLFNTGFVFEVTGSEHRWGSLPTSISLSSHRIDGNYFTQQEKFAAEWLANHPPDASPIYGDHYSWVILRGYLGPWQTNEIGSTGTVPDSSLLFWRSYNVEKDEVFIRHLRSYFAHYKLTELPQLSITVEKANIIYSSSSVRIMSTHTHP